MLTKKFKMKIFNILRQSFIILLISFTLIISIELFVKFFIYEKKTVKNIHGFVMPDDNLIWKLDPELGKKYFNGAFKVNEIGFRDNSYNENAEIKILILGDSVSWGHKIFNYKLTYTYMLEKFIEKSTKKYIEVINASVPGYSTFQHLNYLKNHGLKLKPDIIILQFSLNDVFERYNTVAQFGGDAFFLGIDTRNSIKGLKGWLIRNSHLYEMLMKGILKIYKKRENYNINNLLVDNPSSEIIDAWNLTLSEIDEIHKVAKLHNIPFAVMIAPHELQLYKNNSNQPQVIIKNHAKKNNFEVLNLLQFFYSNYNKNNKIQLFIDDNHFSKTGHFLTAMSLHVFLSINFLNKL